MKNKTSQSVFGYWNEVRGERLAPNRFEIEPSRIADFLPDTFVLEHVEEGSFRYRLAGTRICEHFGYELRGMDFLAGWDLDERAILSHQFKLMTTQGAVTVLTVEVESGSGRTAALEFVILPLVHTRDTVSRYLGVISTQEATLGWLGQEAIVTRALLAHETIWPDGRPHSVIDKLHRQVPFLPHIRHGRIVRADRRQFRVYDGGLSKTPSKP